jgi:hypothetical protein
MTIRAGRRTAALALAPVALLALAACAERGARTPSAPPSAASLPGDAHALVLRVEYTGGFVTPSMLHARLPIVSIYADGRVITEGPVPAIYPGPALPNLQMQEVGQDAVQELLDRALAAGVAETSDLGTPPVADATFTRFTAVTADDTYVREVYALWESAEGGGLTAEQEGARERLSELLTSLTDQSAATEPYAPESVSAVVSPWSDPGDGLSQPEQPGPDRRCRARPWADCRT